MTNPNFFLVETCPNRAIFQRRSILLSLTVTNMKYKKLLWIAAVLAVVGFYLVWDTQQNNAKSVRYETRAALDIGSGVTRLKIAEVDIKTNKISKILFREVIPIPFQDDLESSNDKNFSREIMDRGIVTFTDFKNTAGILGAKKIVAVATESFREAKNASAYVNEIKEKLGIEVNILTQNQEGWIAFKAAVSTCPNECSDSSVVWDVGGGSFQFTIENQNHDLEHFNGTFASIAFKNYLIETIQKKSLENTATPNPISAEEGAKAVKYAEEFSLKVGENIKEKMKDSQNTVIGIGGIFLYGIRPYLLNKTDRAEPITLTRQNLDTLIAKFVGLDDVSVSQTVQSLLVSPQKHIDDEPLDKSLVAVTVSNFFYIKGFMEGLGIDQVVIKDVCNADSLLITPAYW